jgi:hypothetical protein
MKIIINQSGCPLSSRRFDWAAYVDGKEESGPYGWGRSPEAALEELQEKLDCWITNGGKHERVDE